jgi:peptide/nickel transport system permease protein
MKAKYWTSGSILNLAFLGVFILVALLSPFIANDKPILCKDDEAYHLGLFSSQNHENCQVILRPVIPYSYHNIDEKNANFAPPLGEQNLLKGQQRHWLGTDQLGRDVASGMVHGTRIALLTGGLSMSIALIIGLFFGLLGGFYGNDTLQVKRYTLINFTIGVFFLLYFFSFPSTFLLDLSALLLFTTFYLIIAFSIFLAGRKLHYLKKRIRIPLDLIFSNFIEIFQSLPGSFIILILVSLFTKASIFNVILVIGLLRWPMIARYVRAEMLKIKEHRYIEASRAIGMTDWRIIIHHALPATLTPVIVALAFGFSSAILLESTLSFLGIGLPAEHVSFGSMLAEARKNYEAWWLAVFPGLAIFSLVYVFNYLGDHLAKWIDKK